LQAVDVNLSLVERELSQQVRRRYHPDTVAVSSSSIQDKENFPKTKHRKLKRKTYSYSTDLLGLSQTVDSEYVLTLFLISVVAPYDLIFKQNLNKQIFTSHN